MEMGIIDRRQGRIGVAPAAATLKADMYRSPRLDRAAMVEEWPKLPAAGNHKYRCRIGLPVGRIAGDARRGNCTFRRDVDVDRKVSKWHCRSGRNDDPFLAAQAVPRH